MQSIANVVELMPWHCLGVKRLEGSHASGLVALVMVTLRDPLRFILNVEIDKT